MVQNIDRLAPVVYRFLGYCLLSASLFAADASLGEQVLEDTNCKQCHRVVGKGGGKAGVDAPPLNEAFARRLTAPDLAAALWNHTPAMWTAMNQEAVPRPKMTGGEAEDLFAYLYSLRYFDRTGDAKRGRDAIDQKGCSGCHSVVSTGTQDKLAPAVSYWRATDPLGLARQMWNHSVSMKQEMAKAKLPWATITGRDLSDIQAYVRQVQSKPPQEPARVVFRYTDDLDGRALYQSLCRSCHVGSLAPERRTGAKTFLDIAAGMWNHSPRMAPIPLVSDAEMNAVVGYVWRLQYMGEPGQVGRGRDAFQKKGCAGCHEGTGDARLFRADRAYTVFNVIALAWEHGTLMQQAMKQQKIAWPTLSATDISDIAVYLNARSQALPRQ